MRQSNQLYTDCSRETARSVVELSPVIAVTEVWTRHYFWRSVTSR